MTTLSFYVRGRAVPQGGLTAYNRGDRAVLTHKRRPELEAWRTAIADEARHEMRDRPILAGAVHVVASFDASRPAAHYLPRNSRRAVPELKPTAPQRPTGKPDIDKLIRAVLDALTGVVFLDDSQVTMLSVQKRYGAQDAGPGLLLRVEALDE